MYQRVYRYVYGNVLQTSIDVCVDMSMVTCVDMSIALCIYMCSTQVSMCVVQGSLRCLFEFADGSQAVQTAVSGDVLAPQQQLWAIQALSGTVVFLQLQVG